MRQTLIDISSSEESEDVPINLADTDTWGPHFELFKSAVGPGTDHTSTEPSIGSSKRKPEYRMNLPDPSGGKDIMVTSSTVDPTELKELKECANMH